MNNEKDIELNKELENFIKDYKDKEKLEGFEAAEHYLRLKELGAKFNKYAAKLDSENEEKSE